MRISRMVALGIAAVTLAMPGHSASASQEMETVYEQCRNSCTRAHTREVTICAFEPGTISKLQQCVRDAGDELRQCWADC